MAKRRSQSTPSSSLGGARGRGLGWLLVSVLGVAAVYAPLLRGEQLFVRDLSRSYYGLKLFITGALQAGVLPQWWPHDALGMPLLTTTFSMVFHPTTLLFLMLPFRTAFGLFVLLGALVYYSSESARNA